MKISKKNEKTDMHSLALDAMWKGCLKVVAVNTSTWEYYVLKDIPYDDTDETSQPTYIHSDEEFLESGDDIWEYVRRASNTEAIHPDDIGGLNAYMVELRSRHESNLKRNHLTYVMRHKVAGVYRWVRIELIYPTAYSEENPICFYVLKMANGNDYSRQDVLRLISYGYRKVIRVNLERDSFEIVKLDSDEWMTVPGKRISYSEWVHRFVDRYIHPDDQEKVLEVTDINYIRESMRSGNYPIRCYYRRMGQNIKEVRMEIIPSSEYAQTESTVLLYVQDVPDHLADTMDSTNTSPKLAKDLESDINDIEEGINNKSVGVIVFDSSNIDGVSGYIVEKDTFVTLLSDIDKDMFNDRVQRLKIEVNKESPPLGEVGYAWAEDALDIYGLIDEAKKMAKGK